MARPQKLTAANIEKARPGDILRDADLKGLHLRVFPKGAVYYLFYRTRQGIQRRPRIGPAAAISLPQARDTARQWLALVSAGGDPSAAFHKAKGKTLADLHTRYMEAHARPKKKKGPAHEDDMRWQNCILPALGATTLVADVTRVNVADLHHEMRATPIMANRIAALLHKAFELCEGWGWRPEHTNPVKVERYPERKRRRYPTLEEAIALLKALDDSRAEMPYFVGLVELLCYTGCRRMEVQAARRAWITAAGLELPDDKTNNGRLVQLNEHARAVIDRLPIMLGNPYLIPGRKPKHHLVDASKPWRRICKKAGITAGRADGGLVPHDLRRFFASAGLSAGVTLEQVGELLGQREWQTTKGYAFLLTDKAALAATTAGDAVRARMVAAE